MGSLRLRKLLMTGIVLLAGAYVLWLVVTWLFGVAPGLAVPILFLNAVVLIGLVLIQRGKGGGLAGAFGGMGGQSAFGTKAGDTFTKITIGVAAVWIFLCVVCIQALAPPEGRLGRGGGSNPVEQRGGAEPLGDGTELPGGPEGDSGADGPAP